MSHDPIRMSSSIPDEVLTCADCSFWRYDYSDMWWGFCSEHDDARVPGVTIPCSKFKDKPGTCYQSDIDRRYKYPSKREPNPFETETSE